MDKLAALIIISLAVLSTPLSLKKLIDHANRRKSERPEVTGSRANGSNGPSRETYKTYDDEDDCS